MRFNVLVLVPTIVALASYVQGHSDVRRSLLRRSEIVGELAEISTRDLIDELSSRLEARAGNNDKPPTPPPFVRSAAAARRRAQAIVNHNQNFGVPSMTPARRASDKENVGTPMRIARFTPAAHHRQSMVYRSVTLRPASSAAFASDAEAGPRNHGPSN
ncbi:hypothetical protein DFP72DRAFT_856724 [Ephemerocybe angulata]|uniref:Uncharacterized protein n=1 Tax=Ephemerocybe angulata TaxID=980116 RepID=A0A8H6HG29_9AGAR|nr:hypothetical protein DFP72DRAFT_856724 [Tulosesus angulatus]